MMRERASWAGKRTEERSLNHGCFGPAYWVGPIIDSVPAKKQEPTAKPRVGELSVEMLGQVRSAEIQFGDLTVFVGPQATGKSIVLQMLKLFSDVQSVKERMRLYGFDPGTDVESFLDAYLGEGMKSVYDPKSTRVSAKDRSGSLRAVIGRSRSQDEERSVFFIPAQRVMTLGDGWPRPFGAFRPADPFVVKDFSDELRVLLDRFFARESSLFPKPNRLKEALRLLLNESLFRGFDLRVDQVHAQKRLVLWQDGGATKLPFMVWSAGQREFVPLLLGLYWLLPGQKLTKRPEIDTVIIEEPEMGLHPKGVHAVMVLILDLLWRGYRVCLSTHSPQVLDLMWAMRVICQSGGKSRDFLRIFFQDPPASVYAIGRKALEAKTKVYYFASDGHVQDISALDPGSESIDEAGWGGLTEFSSRVGDAVAAVTERKGA